MSFDYSSEQDRSNYMSLKGMINRREGVFYSQKQSKFLFGAEPATSAEEYAERAEDLKKYFGTDIYPGEKIITVNASMTWSHYRGRSVIPAAWQFMIDEYGVKRMYRIRYNGNLKDGAAPNPKRTELLFVRGEAAQPFLDELKASFTEAEEAKQAAIAEDAGSDWVGEVGKRVEKTMTLRNCIVRDGDWGSYLMFVMNDEDGNLYFMNGGENKFVDGEARVRGTVKAHFTTKDGIKSTRLARPHFCK